MEIVIAETFQGFPIFRGICKKIKNVPNTIETNYV